ncbi:protein translocase subunit SecD [Sphingomonas desiccabilis]|uniref:Protein translocase subunit SecD n=1 Tax=Sphingomonas desiccabilis TaxID=429134 RepID=A0A4Q2IYP0_9SPHN|nr:protein translocase subunit SecD [Sphingomonas desiccabilis]MBB3909665.1 preprotein translocase subunit SecD [Sphingomonas desiccabilis]RXZ34364.1 protein translocase subunit SecD [Sphingomonas desiccabilis]
MLDFPRWKVRAIWLGILVMVLLAVPSLLPERTRAQLPGWVPTPTINLGLDLAGGSYILLEAKTSDVATTRLEQMREQVATEMRRAPRVQIGDISTRGGRLSFMVRNVAQVDAAREKLLSITGGGAGLTGQREWDIEVVDQTRFVLTQTDAGLTQAVDRAMDDATDVVRRRIDELGTREPTIIRQGSNRIVVQVPGLDDPKALKDLLGKTARLEFKLVDTTADPAAVLRGDAPVGSQILRYQGTGQPIAVKRNTIISGDQLADARQSYDQNGQPNVDITFDSVGGRRFATVTRENVNKPFAIIVDNQVISAPNINEPILGGRASIAGGFTVDGANQLAIALRSGKLPVDLTVVQESTVSPELGDDSIRAGILASVIAAVAVIAFMILTYGRFGIYATTAVVINVLVILAVMGMLNATLTLPGIAGFVLTIGTAVDANVLINERIREERRRGRSVIQSLELGYKEASRTIFEANVTHAIAGLIMLLLGSGPIRGFAVVLLLGIATSVFTAVTFTRMLVSGWVRKNRPTEIHI